MKSRIIWIIGNLLLIGKYFFDKASIQCEPCLTSDCPACETDYMKYFWIYIIVWNLLGLLLELITRKKSWNKWWKRKV